MIQTTATAEGIEGIKTDARRAEAEAGERNPTKKRNRNRCNSSSGSDSESSYESDSDAQHSGRAARGGRRGPVTTDEKLQVIRPLNDLFSKGGN